MLSKSALLPTGPSPAQRSRDRTPHQNALRCPSIYCVRERLERI
jgi:hypothetical protein